MDYKEWFSELKITAIDEYGWPKKTVDTFDDEAFRVSYEEGSSPEDAFLDDLSCGWEE